MTTEPTWNEEDIEDDLMNDLPDGRNDRKIFTKEDESSCEALNNFFNNAWIH